MQRADQTSPPPQKPQQVEAALLPFLPTTTTTSSSDPTNNHQQNLQQLGAQLADRALEFLLHWLPALPLPPLEGATEDNAVAYKIEGLDLGGVRLRRVGVGCVI